MQEYYGNNDYRDYLMHYGKKGMTWGKHKYVSKKNGEYIYNDSGTLSERNALLGSAARDRKLIKRPEERVKADKKMYEYLNNAVSRGVDITEANKRAKRLYMLDPKRKTVEATGLGRKGSPTPYSPPGRRELQRKAFENRTGRYIVNESSSANIADRRHHQTKVSRGQKIANLIFAKINKAKRKLKR